MLPSSSEAELNENRIEGWGPLMGPFRESLKHPNWSKMKKIVTFLVLYAIFQLNRFNYRHTLCRTIIAFIHLFIHWFIHFVDIIIVSFGQQPKRDQWSMISQGNLFSRMLRDSTPTLSVRRSVRPSVPLYFFWFLRSLASLLLPKWSSDLKYGPCPPARDRGSHVSGLVTNKWELLIRIFSAVQECRGR